MVSRYDGQWSCAAAKACACFTAVVIYGNLWYGIARGMAAAPLLLARVLVISGFFLGGAEQERAGSFWLPPGWRHVVVDDGLDVVDGYFSNALEACIMP